MYLDWDTKQFNEEKCHGVIVNQKNGKLKIIGEFKNGVKPGAQLMYWAANPYNTRFSYFGSGLAYSSPEQAYDRSVNVGMVGCAGTKFSFTIKVPSSYYVLHGLQIIPPHIHMKILENGKQVDYFSIKLGDPLKHRLLHNPAERKSCEFYNNRKDLPFRSQEQILRDSALNVAQKQCSFWGLKPAQ
jgi:hypothetical protein